MKILLLHDCLIPVKGEPEPRTVRAGERVSVLHYSGVKLMRRFRAKWIEAEEGDPIWPAGRPPEMWCLPKQAEPVVDKMVRGAMNK